MYYHQSKNGSSDSLNSSASVSDSGYSEKFEVSLGDLVQLKGEI